jgi:bacillithiol synthase
LNVVPHPMKGSELVRRYLEGDADALRFYPGGHPADPDAYRARAASVGARFDRQSRERLAGMLAGGGVRGRERLQAFVDGEGLAITTGQQPGLFGGPLYSVYKALTAAALARRVERLLGVPVIPVFWVASEDHDWDEVRRLTMPDPANELVELELPVPEGAGDAPLHRVVPGASLAKLRDALVEGLPASDFRPDVVADLEATYNDASTLPGAFAGLLERQLAEAGVFLLSPETPAAQRAALPVLLAEAEGSVARAGAMAARAAELDDAGLTVQVPILDGGVNLFLEGKRGRDRLFLEDAEAGEEPRFRLRRSGESLSLSDLRRIAAEDPARLSPNVLLRPVVESVLVPTLAYVAGPGETAYYAQTAPVFDAHGIGQPIIHPRLSATVVEAKIGKVLEKFDLPLAALSRPHHEVAGDLLREDLPDEVRRALGALRGSIAKGAKELTEAVRAVDPTLSGPVEHLRNQGFSLIDDVEKKVVQARKRESGIALQQLAKAQLHLFPGGKPQERVFPAVYYTVRYGPAAMAAWIEAAEDAVLPPLPGDGTGA